MSLLRTKSKLTLNKVVDPDLNNIREKYLIQIRNNNKELFKLF